MKWYKSFCSFVIVMILSSSLTACGLFGGSQESTSGELNEQDEAVLDEAIRERTEKNPPQEDPDEAESKWGPDSATAVRKYSLYYQYYKQNSYDDALPYWRWMFFNAPRQSKNLYIHGAKIIKHQVNNTTGETKQAYIDTLMMVYDQRIEYFNNKGYVLGRKGMDLNRVSAERGKQAYDILLKSLEMEGNNSKSYVPYYLVRAATDAFEAEAISKSELMDAYNQAESTIKHNLQQNAGGDWKQMKDRIKNLIKPYLSCSDLIARYKSEYQGETDAETLKEYQKNLEQQECTDDPFYMKLTEAVYEKDPTGEGAASLAVKWKEEGNTEKALKYYKEALENAANDDKGAQYALSIAQIKKEQEDFTTAREYAKESIAKDSEYGKAYIFLGDLYVAGASKCGDDFKQSAVYWVAVDQYKKAKEADESLAERADKRINTYSELFPAQEKFFFHNYKVGDTYKVECWINESTTVRKPVQ